MSHAADTSGHLPYFHVVGFSGHRQVARPVKTAEAIGKAIQALKADIHGEWIALSSVAAGADQLFVDAAQAQGLAWHALLPLPRADFSSDFAPEQWQQVEARLARAEQQRIIDDAGTREDAYMDCGFETVNGADVMLVVWDGEPARGKGGTADVVAYANSMGKPLLIIDADTLVVRRENWDRVRRSDATLNSLNPLPPASQAWARNPFGAPAAIMAFQQNCDAAATRGAPQARRITVTMVLLHVMATLIAAAAVAYHLHLVVVPWAKLLCLSGAVGFAFLLRHRSHSGQNWIRCRLAAEFCRCALSVWGLPRALPLLQDLDVPPMRALARSLRVLHGRDIAGEPVSVAEFKRIYIAERIDDQLAYFARQESRAAPQFARLKAWFWIATTLALGCTLIYAAVSTLGIEVPFWMQTTLFDFLPITLPIVATALISLISINDLQRRVARYREMHTELAAGRRQIGFCETWNSIERVVLKIERALLQEVLEWHSTTSFAESH
jgi:hypothetical protein